VPVDNDIYKADSDIWWDEHQPLNIIRTGLNPARLRYFHQVFAQIDMDPAGKTVLDIGCGGGLVAEELARLGATVIGVDPAESSLSTARAHARLAGLEIDYRLGAGERLPLDDASVDIACCVDVLEHVDDLDAVIRETARVLKPGGIYLYDTINRTLVSKLVMIKLCQEWRRTAWMPPNLHDFAQFIKPAELRALLAQNGLTEGGVTGMAPSVKPPRLYRLLRQLKKGEISHAEFGRAAEFVLTRDKSVSYIGFAINAPTRSSSTVAAPSEVLVDVG
jgi:2-polyprenyl-6-hydroxyphenyl methylase/3-demethylubiquinone-9 3-methyltransferase